MKNIFFFIILAIVHLQCKQPTADIKKKGEIENTEYNNYSQNKESLSVIPITNYYADSIKKSEVMYDIENNKKEGMAILYYNNGNLKQKGMWHNNKQEGVWKFYDEEGNTSSEISFKDDNQDGPSIFYNKKGVVIEKTNWKIGKIDGTSLEYYDNGKIKRITKWISGKKISESKYAYSDSSAGIKK